MTAALTLVAPLTIPTLFIASVSSPVLSVSAAASSAADLNGI